MAQLEGSGIAILESLTSELRSLKIAAIRLKELRVIESIVLVRRLVIGDCVCDNTLDSKYEEMKGDAAKMEADVAEGFKIVNKLWRAYIERLAA